MAKGAAWMVSLRLLDRSIGFVSTLILARLLVPADFGLVAMATVVLHLLMAMSDFSVHVRLVQKPDLDDKDLNGAWSLQLVLGSAQALVVAVSALPAAQFYADFRLVPIMYVLAAIALLRGSRNIGVVMFQREMAFDRDFLLMAIGRIASFAVTISLAILVQSYWALIAGMCTGTIVELVLSYRMHPFRPRFSTERWRDLFAFSKWLLFSNTLWFLGQRSADLILGRVIGARAVGLYSVGAEIGTLPTSELVAPINRAALPGYSRLTETEGALKRGYLDVIGIITIVAVPAGVGISASAEILIPLLLGNKWLDAIPVVHFVALAGAIGALTTNNNAVYMAMGLPRLTTILLAFRLMFLIPGILIGSTVAGVVGVAQAYLTVEATMLFASLAIILNTLKLSLKEYVGVVYRPVVGSAIMYVFLTVVLVPHLETRSQAPVVIDGVVTIILGAIIYVASVGVLWASVGRPIGAESTALAWTRELLVRVKK